MDVSELGALKSLSILSTSHYYICSIWQNFSSIKFSLFSEGLVNAGYESSMIGYGLSADHRNYRMRFKDEAMTFAKTAKKFEKLLPKEITNSNLGFEIWNIAQKELNKPIVYMKFK